MKALFGTQGRAFTMNLKAACAVNQIEIHIDKFGVKQMNGKLTKAKCCTTGTLERSAGKVSFVVVTACVIQHLIFLTRQLHRRLKQQTLPGTHLPPFIEDFKAFETACQLWPYYGQLFIFWWQSLESISGKESLAFC